VGGTVVGTAAQVDTQPAGVLRGAAAAAEGVAATTAAPEARASSSRRVDTVVSFGTPEVSETRRSDPRNVEPPIDAVKTNVASHFTPLLQRS
jgi:hypothetical protein